MVGLYTPLSQEFLQIPLGQSVTQVPPDGDQDHLRREPEPGEGRFGLNRARDPKAFHSDSIVLRSLGTKFHLGSVGARSMQQCPTDA
jgi:hypothetical protein